MATTMSELQKAAHQALLVMESLVDEVDEDCEEPNCDECKAWRPFRAAMKELQEAIARPDCRDFKISNTHSEGCWSWGPAHYACACAEIAKLRGWNK